MPEERDIEKRLRAAAEQRRKMAELRFELHPAERRLLQGEVARTLGKKAGASKERKSNFGWYRFAAGVCTLAILCFGTWVYLRPAPPAGQLAVRSKVAAVRQAAEESFDKALAPKPGTAGHVQEIAAKNPVAARELNSSVMPAAAEPVPRATPDIGTAPTAPAPPVAADINTVSASPPAPSPVAAPAFLAGDNEDKKAKSALAGKDTLGGLAVGQVATRQQFLNFSNVAAFGGAATFALANQAVTNQLAQNYQDATGVRLLATFRLEQDGNRIRIVDGDGSVYEGELLAAAQNNNANQAIAYPVNDALTGDLSKLDANRLPAQQNLDGLAWQNFRFTAAGTNVSLQQRVVIDGEFVAAANGANAMNFAAVPPAGNHQWNAPAQNNAQNNQSPVTGRLVGRAVTADGRQVELNAVSK